MQRSVTSLLNACCVVGQGSPQRWWCPFLSQNWAALSCFSSSQGWMSTSDTTARFCWRSRCCQSSVALPVTRTHFSRMAHRRTMLARQFSYCSRRHHNSSPLICNLLTVRIKTRSTTGSGVGCKNMCTRRPSTTPTTWRGASLTHGRASRRASSTTPLTSGQYGCVQARRPEVVTLNICYNWPILFRDTDILQEKTHACGVLKRLKRQFPDSCFAGSAETLVGRGGIINHRSIAYSLSNISAKNYRNRLMCVESIVGNISVIFWDTVYIVCSWCILYSWHRDYATPCTARTRPLLCSAASTSDITLFIIGSKTWTDNFHENIFLQTCLTICEFLIHA